MISLGDHVVVHMNATILGHDICKGSLYFGYVDIGAQSTVGAASIIMPGSILAQSTVIKELTLITNYDAIDTLETWTGSPAIKLPGQGWHEPLEPPGCTFRLLQMLCLIAIVQLVHLAAFAAHIISGAIPTLFGSAHPWEATVATSLLGFVPFAIFILVLSILLKWVVLGRTRLGVLHVSAGLQVRLWFTDTFLVCTPTMLSMSLLNAAVLRPMYLRLLGSKVMANAFLSLEYIRGDVDLVSVGANLAMGGDCMISCSSWIGSSMMEFSGECSLHALPCALLHLCFLGVLFNLSAQPHNSTLYSLSVLFNICSLYTTCTALSRCTCLVVHVLLLWWFRHRDR